MTDSFEDGEIETKIGSLSTDSVLTVDDQSVQLEVKDRLSIVTKAPENDHEDQERLNRSKGPILKLDTINPLLCKFKVMEYAARGPVIMRALQIESEMHKGMRKPFTKILKATLGDAQALGQQPITFVRQVLAGVCYPNLLEAQNFPRDVKDRVSRILKSLNGASIGAYTDSKGLEIIRKDVAEYIKQRDGGQFDAFVNDIILTAGASDGIRSCLKLLISGNGSQRVACLTPIPEYPLYNASLLEFDITQIGYYLNGAKNWSIDMLELENVYKEANEKYNVKAIVVINPGNPTGHVMSRENIEDVIRFAYRNRLVIFADEVYQMNVYGDSKFYSFRKVLLEMDNGIYASKVEIFSFFSCSKGYLCECGVRGAYFETQNLDPEVKSILHASIAAKLCPTVLGQVALDCVVNPPIEGTPSFETFYIEKTKILKTLAERARLFEETLNSLPGITCSKIDGAMYGFPQLSLSNKAILEAQKLGMEPDVFYALELLESQGIAMVPGSGLGQRPGTYHFRSTILPANGDFEIMLQRFTTFHIQFLQRFEN